MSGSGTFSVARVDDALCVHLTGVWSLDRGLPPPAALERALEGAASARRVVFDTAGLGTWDSSLVTFVAQLVERCMRLGVGIERRGLPPGLLRLLALAEAVPEKAGARAHPVRASIAVRIGTATIAAWQEAVGWLAFLGLTNQARAQTHVAAKA